MIVMIVSIVGGNERDSESKEIVTLLVGCGRENIDGQHSGTHSSGGVSSSTSSSQAVAAELWVERSAAGGARVAQAADIFVSSAGPRPLEWSQRPRHATHP
ncbi:Protein of unknown function [Gryllus bimaculatus]|nr:Protein of unknown function [Gryllus bimaculatus]